MKSEISRLRVAIAALLAAFVLLTPCRASPQTSAAKIDVQALPVYAPERLRSEIATIERLLPALADRGAALYLLAHHYLRLGDKAKARDLLKQSVALDEGFDPGQALWFSSLNDDMQFREVMARVHQRYPAVHHAYTAFTLPDKELFPEGLAADSARHIFYMGSMHQRKVLKITAAGQASDFVRQGEYSLGPVGGVHVDADHTVWCATDPGVQQPSEIVHFDTQGRLLERYAAPGAGVHDLNDLVLRGTEAIYVTDTEGNQVFRFDRKSRRFAALNLGRPVFYPNGITISADGNTLYVADMLGVIRQDLSQQRSEDVRPGTHDTLAGNDGLYWFEGALIGVQYGTGSFRLMRWRLAPDGVHVSASEVLERGTDFVSNPTTGAILEQKFYFMTNTGIDNLDDDKIVDPKKLQPLRIAVVPLR